MIINVSRVKAARHCWRLAKYKYELNLDAPGRSMNLTDGGAFHLGAAIGMATNNWDNARAEARKKMDEEIATMGPLPPEEEVEIAEHRRIVDRCIEVYEKAYKDESWHVIQPECEFDVQLGQSEHRIVGKTDALVVWKNNIWLHEHKTTSIQGQAFWDEFLLDMQPTTYMLGIWKSTGILPSGFLLNAIRKPSESQVRNWNRNRKVGSHTGVADYIEYTREPFLRTEQDLLRQEKEHIDTCEEWEWRRKSGIFPMANSQGHCVMWNRKCDYFGLCLSHEAPEEMALLSKRRPDYVDEKRLVQIEVQSNVHSDNSTHDNRTQEADERTRIVDGS